MTPAELADHEFCERVSILMAEYDFAEAEAVAMTRRQRREAESWRMLRDATGAGIRRYGTDLPDPPAEPSEMNRA